MQESSPQSDSNLAMRLRFLALDIALLRTAEQQHGPKFITWHARVRSLLKKHFGEASYEFERFVALPFPEHAAHHETYLQSLLKAEALLFTIFEALIDGPINVSNPVAPQSENKEYKRMNSDIFVVHGHDEGAKESAARFLEKCGLKPIFLREKPNQGRTIIEKFEHFADVGFAVVLLTPDDCGGRRGADLSTGTPRARQNVILELGYFMGKLGRGRVCALYKENVELPSDVPGVVYVKMDSAGAWKSELIRELRATGYAVDANTAIP